MIGRVSRSTMLWLVSLACWSGVAAGSGIPSAVIAPHEFDLPLNFTPIGEFVEYGYVNGNDRAYSVNGRQVDGPDGVTYVGISKLAYLAPLGRHFGYELEALVPLIKIAGHSGPFGVGDPLFAPVLWFKPSDTTTLGADVLIQPAWGDSRFSAHNLVVTPTLFYDANWRGFNLDGDIGIGLPTAHAHEIGGIRDPAHTEFSNLRLAYALTARWSPFFSADWQATGKGQNAQGQYVQDSRSRELAMGGGLMWQPIPASSLAVSYSRTVSGANVVGTDALYFRYVYSW